MKKPPKPTSRPRGRDQMHLRKGMQAMQEPSFSVLKGKTLSAISAVVDEEKVVFNCFDGTAFISEHLQDCCESVAVDRIEGNLSDALDSEILEAIEYEGDDEPPENADSYTWTHQKIVTAKGQVEIVWLGESNGYYGEVPYFRRSHGTVV